MGRHPLVSVLPSIALTNDERGLFFQHILAMVDILPTRQFRVLLPYPLENIPLEPHLFE